jgi:hypothetical protein
VHAFFYGIRIYFNYCEVVQDKKNSDNAARACQRANCARILYFELNPLLGRRKLAAREIGR